MRYDNILDKKLSKCNYFMVYSDRWCNTKAWDTVLINGIHSDWTEWPQPHSLYAHVNTNWLHMDLSVLVKKTRFGFALKI